MENRVQLITYVDRLSNGGMNDLAALLNNEFEGLFGGVHLLPFFDPIDGADAGFDPSDHSSVDHRLGTWNDVKDLASHVGVMSDLIVNHVSADSKQFKDYLEKGESSEYADLFLTVETVFPNGITQDQLEKIYRPRPTSPFTEFNLNDGTTKLLWTTFTEKQIDINVLSDQGLQYLEHILDSFQKAGISMIRLDAAGYAIKKPGTSCFMIDETFDFIADITQKAKSRNIEVLVEIHSYYKTQIEIAKRVDYIYDFALPVLVLDTLFNRDASNLINWLKIAPKNVITVLDTHDGIGIVDVASEGDKTGLIDDLDLDNIVKRIHTNSKDTSKQATGAAASNLDLYQVNCTYFEALGRDEDSYFIARAIQLFVPGIPQIYYVGLMAGVNDMELLEKTNVGRDINRHYYQKNEIDAYIQTDFFARFKELIIVRNSHPAFGGTFELVDSSSHELHIKWTNGSDYAELHLNLESLSLNIRFSGEKEELMTL